MKKRLIFLLIFLTALGTIAYFYINTVFLPVHLKELIIRKAEEFLGRDVSIGDIRYSLLRGVVVDDLTIYQKDDSRSPFVRIDHADFAVPLTSILKNKTILISSLTVRSPYVHVIRRADGSWNFQDLLPQPSATPRRASAVSIGGINVKNAVVELTDLAVSPAVNEVYDRTSLRASLSLREGMRFLFETHTGERTMVRLGGVYRWTSKDFSAAFNAENLSIVRYLQLAGLDQTPQVSVHDGILHWADLRTRYRNGEWTVTGDIRAQTDVDVNIDEKKNIKGTVTALGLALTVKEKTVGITVTNVLMIDRGVITIEDSKTIMGNVQTRDVQIGITGRDMTLQGTLLSKDTYIRVRDYLLIEGDALASGIEFKKHGGTLHLTGTVAFEQPVITFGQNKNVLTGNITARDLIFQREELSRNIFLQSQVDIKAGSLKVPGRYWLKGDFTGETSTLTFLFHEKQLDVQTAFQLMGSEILWEDGRSLTGSFKISDGKLQRKDQKTDATADIETLQTIYHFGGDKTFEGEPRIAVHLTVDPQRTPSLDYSGIMQFTQGRLAGFDIFGEAQDMRGEMAFTRDSLSTRALETVILETPVKVSGTLTDFQRPHADGKLYAPAVDLKLVERIFPQHVEQYKIAPEGTATVEVDYKGLLSAPGEAAFDVKATLHDTRLTTGLLTEPVSDVNGFMRWSNDRVAWKDLGLMFRGKQYTLTGDLRNFSRPILNTEIIGKDLTLNTSVKILNRAFTITSLAGTYHDSAFNLLGEVHLTDDNQPDLDVRGHADFSLGDLGHIFPAFIERHPKLLAKGVLSADFLYKGILKEWRRAVIVADGQSRQLSLYGLSFDTVAFKWGQGDKNYSLLDVTSTFYSGHLTLNTLFDMTTSDIPFTLTARTDRTDVFALKNDTVWKKKEFSGLLTAAVALQGQLLRPEDITGQGSVLIQDGQIWKSNLIKGLWSALLIPEYENIIFTEGLMNFEVKERKVFTRDLLLKSPEVELVGTGWADFDRNIDLMITPEFKELTILKSKSLKKGPTALLTQAEGYLNIKISGTLEKPEYKVTTTPTRVIQKATGVLVEGLQGLFEEIFQ